ncbi:hypothetical protein Q7W06_10875, partial [Streptococcus suis]|nr:hypothetical protein [Streptococcus suis]
MRWFMHQNSHFSLKTVKKTNTKTMFVCNLKEPRKRLFLVSNIYPTNSLISFSMLAIFSSASARASPTVAM